MLSGVTQLGQRRGSEREAEQERTDSVCVHARGNKLRFATRQVCLALFAHESHAERYFDGCEIYDAIFDSHQCSTVDSANRFVLGQYCPLRFIRVLCKFVGMMYENVQI